MEQVLPLDAVEFDADAAARGDLSNMTAEEYLSWVRHQAQELPSVTRSEVVITEKQRHPKSYMPHIEDIPPCPEEFLPSEEWQHQTLFQFAELRNMLYVSSQEVTSRERKIAVPQLKDIEGWFLFCFGSLEIPVPLSNRNAATIVATVATATTATTADFDSNEQQYTSEQLNTDDHGELALDNTTGMAQSTGEEPSVSLLKRKRDVAYQLGITLTATRDNTTTVNSNNNHTDDNINNTDVDIDNHHHHNDDDDVVVDEGSDSASVDQMELEETFQSTMQAALEAQRWSGAREVAPSKSLLLQFDQALTQRLIALHIQWLQDSELSSKRSQWLYGLLARLEKPVHRETAASIRQCYRRCCILRSQLAEAATATATATGEAMQQQQQQQQHETLAGLNVLIAICGCYFGQGEDCIGYDDHINNSGNEQKGDTSNSNELHDDDDDDDEDDSDDIAGGIGGGGWDELDDMSAGVDEEEEEEEASEGKVEGYGSEVGRQHIDPSSSLSGGWIVGQRSVAMPSATSDIELEDGEEGEVQQEETTKRARMHN